MKVSVLKGFAGPRARLAVLSIFLLGMAGIAHAQAPGAAAQANPKAAAATGQGKAEPATVAPGKPAPKGNHEGIKVHGHWTIEVKNPDGKLATHREFENSLVANTGANLLSAILGGTLIPGSWRVVLADNTGFLNVILINQANSAAQAFCQNILVNGVLQGAGAGSCSTSLSVASADTVTFTGSGTVPNGFPSAIGYVETDNLACGPPIQPAPAFLPWQTLLPMQLVTD